MKKFMPVILAVVGLAGGLTAGAVMKPAPVLDTLNGDAYVAGATGDAEGAHGDAGGGHGKAKSDGHGAGHAKGGNKSDTIYVGLKKPFFAPVLRGNNKHTLIRLDIHLEVPSEMEDKIEKHDPKLRDGFLRAVMSFAHEGGFARVHGSEGFEVLSDDLLLSARSILGNDVKAVLIGEILTRES